MSSFKELDELRTQLAESRDAERQLSNAYLKLRSMIPGAYDTPHAPSSEQVWDVTEKALERLAEKAWRYDELNR